MIPAGHNVVQSEMEQRRVVFLYGSSECFSCSTTIAPVSLSNPCVRHLTHHENPACKS